VFKNFRQSVHASAKPTKHQQEMAILRAHHEKVMGNSALRQAALVGAGVLVRSADGKLVVAKPYETVIVSKRAV
jgi:hypothetical protein